MSEDRKTTHERRRFLKLVGGSAVLLPVFGLAACSGGDDRASVTDAPKAGPAMVPPTAKEAPTKAPAAAAPPAADASVLPRLEENDAQAKALAYVHDATAIDPAEQPRYVPGQACVNCVLYQGAAGDEWGACGIFPGKSVKGTGWCSAYAALTQR